MAALNINDDVFVVRGEQSKIQFPYLQPTATFRGETFGLNIYKTFPTTRKGNRNSTFKISSGMYHQAKDLFKEFRYITLQLLPDSRGDYKSNYVLDLCVGITEVYVYCDTVSPSLAGDSSSSILKIIPVANETNDQIVKYFSVPLFFGVKKQYFDTIEIETRISSGTPIKFISGQNCEGWRDSTNLFGKQLSLQNLLKPPQPPTYPQSILFHPESSQKNLLNAGLFCKDTACEYVDTNLAAAGKNTGLKERWKRVKEGKVFDICRMLLIGLGTQPRLLIRGTTIRIRLLKAKDEFAILTNPGSYLLDIENISRNEMRCIKFNSSWS
ncbi:uncharacterized protein CEXT_745561 [Caerostris extrusa]|uniref:Uncharacterized protein n=1 Tax=Caerostris extrusa TaxID=172846 RepID=A0AAV4QK32_CAEEX|nr:uncharacterized protein CEXT_745561 [Caerostris extrusa]